MQYNLDIRKKQEFDVVVVGAGPAGISAAVSSARMGLNTALVERYGIVGGSLTIGCVGPLMGNVSKGTIVDEFKQLLQIKEPYGAVAHDFEHAKTVLTDLVNKSNISLMLQTPVVEAVKDGERLTGLIVGTKNGLEEIGGKVFIDATGDGTVSYLAGAETRFGREGDGLVQPVTIMFTLAGIDDSKAISPQHNTYYVRLADSGFREKCREAARKGLLPKNASFVRLYRTNRPNECMVNASQENYINGLDTDDLARAEASLREQTNIIRDFLRNNVAGFENCYVTGSSETLGVRETRRVMGEYMLTAEDLLTGRKFKDAVVSEADFILDIHNPAGAEQADDRRVKPYDIPYRCLVPLKVEGLLTSGRCISGTHEAHGSYRVMYICMATGHAAGIAAALSAKHNVLPRELDYRLLRRELLNLGIRLSKIE